MIYPRKKRDKNDKHVGSECKITVVSSVVSVHQVPNSKTTKTQSIIIKEATKIQHLPQTGIPVSDLGARPEGLINRNVESETHSFCLGCEGSPSQDRQLVYIISVASPGRTPPPPLSS